MHVGPIHEHLSQDVHCTERWRLRIIAIHVPSERVDGDVHEDMPAAVRKQPNGVRRGLAVHVRHDTKHLHPFMLANWQRG